MPREVQYRPERAKKVPLLSFEEPLGPEEVQRVLGVFYTMLQGGPRTRALPGLLKDLSEEQLSQIKIAAEQLALRAEMTRADKLRTRKRREGKKKDGEESSLAS